MSFFLRKEVRKNTHKALYRFERCKPINTCKGNIIRSTELQSGFCMYKRIIIELTATTENEQQNEWTIRFSMLAEKNCLKFYGRIFMMHWLQSVNNSSTYSCTVQLFHILNWITSHEGSNRFSSHECTKYTRRCPYNLLYSSNSCERHTKL